MVTIDNNGVLTVTEGTVGNYRIIATDKLTGKTNYIDLSINVAGYLTGKFDSRIPSGSTISITIEGQRYNITSDENNKFTLLLTNISSLANGYNWTGNFEVLDFTHLETSTIEDMSYLCAGISCCKELNFQGCDLSSVRTIEYICVSSGIENINFQGCDLSNLESMRYSFIGSNNLTNIDFSNLNTVKLKNIEYCFCNCANLSTVNLTNIDFSSVENCDSLFTHCTNLENIIGIENLNFTNSLTQIPYLFEYCDKLTSIDISKWNTSSVVNMRELFANNSNLTTIGLPQIGDGTHDVNTGSLTMQCNKLSNIITSGKIYNGIDFSYNPLTLASAKVILNTLQEPYAGSQTITFKQSTIELIMQDAEALSLAREKVALGWTINGIS